MKKTINYAILTTIDFSITRFFLPFAYELKRRGINVFLIAKMSDNFLKTNSSNFYCYNIDMQRGFHLKQTFSSIAELRTFFTKHKINVVEYATENISLPASIAAKFAKIPLRIYNHWGNLFVGFNGIKRLIVKIIEKTIASNSTHIRQVSFGNLELSVKNKIYKRNKAEVLGKGGTVGVDLSVFDISKKSIWRKKIRTKYNISEDSYAIGYVGRIQKDKGLNELLESFKKLREKYNNLYLMLIGFLDERNAIDQSNINYINTSEFVILTGKVEDPEKYISAIDLLVHPTYREGFGMVLQEAGALKTPIITTDIIGPGEFIENYKTGLLVPIKNANALLETIEYALNNMDNMFEMAEMCYKYTTTFFDRKVMIEQIVKDRISLIDSKFGD